MTHAPATPKGPEVAEAYLLGQLSEHEVAVYEASLQRDPALLEQLAQAMQIMSLVRQEFSDQAEFAAANLQEPLLQDFNTLLKELGEYEAAAETSTLPSQDGSCQVVPSDAGSFSFSDLFAVRRYALRQVVFSRRGLLAASTLAAVIVLMVTVFAMDWRNSTQPSLDGLAASGAAPIVATLSAEYDAVWAEGTAATGSALRSGDRLTLIEGFAEVTTARGAVAILEAPITVELLDNDNAIRLYQGKLVGLCHTESAKGFTVKTGHVTITDLGTEFGVTVTPTGTEATVFVGEIAIKTPDEPSQVITHGRTASITVVSEKPTLAIEDNKQPAKTYTQRLPRPALVTQAVISLPGVEAEVVPNGVYEDTKLFSDRPHELNGIDSSGLPANLIGGDLVRMPASARPDVTPEVDDRLQLELELAELSDVYLLVMQNAQADDWLERDYHPTGLLIGVDLVGDTPGGEIMHHTRGQGPGESIELTYEVWQRKQPAYGNTVVAGPIELSMYSVVVVPRRDGPRLD